MASKAPALYLIDGHAQLYRAYHTPAFSNRRATDGTPTGALYGFFLQLKGVRSRFKPDFLGCVFDPKGPVFREKVYEGYKAQRAPMPDDLRKQVPLAFELCKGYGIPAIQVEEFEADDVLGTLARQAVAKGHRVVIVTGDKDLLQLVDEQIHVYDPMKEIDYDAEKVEEVKGLKPTQIVDWLGLMGDSVDNIPGVTGVGEQTAVKLLQEHGTLEQALAHYQEKFKDRKDELLAFVDEHRAEAEKPKEERKAVKPPKGVKVVEAYLFAEVEQARASRELARIRCDAPVTFNADDFREVEPDRKTVVPLLQRLDFRQFLRDVGGAEEDLLTVSEQKAREEAVARDYRIVDTKEKLSDFAKLLTRQKRIAFDTETTGLRATEARIVGMSFSWEKSTAWYLPVRGPMGEVVIDEKDALAACRSVLEDEKVAKVGQNAKYDINVMRGHGVSLCGLAFDTLLGGWLLDPGALRHDLDTLAFNHLGIRKTATESLIGKGKAESMDMVPVADVARYASEDADVTWQLGETLAPKLEQAGLIKLMNELETPLVDVLAEMEWTGVRVDADLLRQMSNELGKQLQAMEEEIYRLAGERFTINSPKQLGAILFGKMGLASKAKTATGQQSTSEDVLQGLANQGHELPKLVLEFRQFAKLKSTYVDLLPNMINPKTGRIHASFNQTGAETGRLSSNDPNLQNIPVRSDIGRSIRAAFKPGEPGWKILGADYSQIELRILAHYSQDPVLLKAFADNKDIHTAVAAQIFGVKEKDVTKDQRARAKTVNFGILYGQTPYGLGQTLGIPQREAQEIIHRFFDGHPNVRACLDGIIAEAREKGFVTTIYGRRRFIPQLKEKAQERFGERIAVNTVFQGSAADLIKKAMLDIHRELHAPEAGWKARMILQIHDELLFECPPDEVKDLTRMVKQKMEGALTLKVPLSVEVGVGDDWLSAKD
ncbi:MAG: DNA polymerase I [Planctomycetota bacterium]|nr:DNA polymerase I [Planctomycetota bacterium]